MVSLHNRTDLKITNAKDPNFADKSLVRCQQSQCQGPFRDLNGQEFGWTVLNTCCIPNKIYKSQDTLITINSEK